MSPLSTEMRTFIVVLAVIAVASIAAAVTLAVAGYSSAGAFAVASACVGVLGTLAAQQFKYERDNQGPPA